MHMSAGRGHLRGMARRGFIHGNNAEGLEPAGAIERLHNDARTLIGRLIAIPPKAGHVQQHIGAASVRHDKAEALACVKPKSVAGFWKSWSPPSR